VTTDPRQELERVNAVLAENTKLLAEHRQAQTVVRAKRLFLLLAALDFLITLAAIWLPPHGQIAMTAGLVGIPMFMASVSARFWDE
jgi:hypothetical protein